MTNSTAALAIPSAKLTLTVERALDHLGQPILRRFTASTELLGRVVSSTAGSRYSAHNNLQRQIRMLGFEPMWVAVRDLTVLEEGQDEEPEEKVVPITEPEIESATADSSEIPAEETDVGEHEDPIHGLVNSVPVLDKSGWLTPLSDSLAYKLVYLAAWKLVNRVSVYSFRDLDSVEATNMRVEVAAVMMSGDAGESIGIAAKAVNPWALGTNGQREMLWVRVAKGTPDPTTKPFRPGNGVSREAYLMTLSNRPAYPDRAEEMRIWRERKSARRYVGTKGITTVGQKDEREVKRGQAHAAGCIAKGIAFENGADMQTAERDYRWVYCATLRNLGEVHAEYERQLAEAGITEQDILEYATQQKTA